MLIDIKYEVLQPAAVHSTKLILTNLYIKELAIARCLIRLILYRQCYVFYVPALQDMYNVLQIPMHLCRYLAGDCLDLHCVLPSAVIVSSSCSGGSRLMENWTS